MSNIGRNDPCPCGSGLKYKKCCINKQIQANPFSEQREMENMMNALLKAQKSEKAKNGSTYGRYVATHHTGQIINYLISLQLIPANHGKNIRIEEMLVESYKSQNGGAPVTIMDLKREIAKNYAFNYLEDTPEGLFTENVLFHGGNFIVFPGITAKSADIFRSMVESIYLLSNELPAKFKDEAYQGITLLLELGNLLAQRAGLNANIYVEQEGDEFILPDHLTDHSISLEELEAYCNQWRVSDEVLLDLALWPDDERLNFDDPDLNPFLDKPLVIFEDRVYFALVTAQMVAVNEYIINTAIKYACADLLLKGYHDALWNDTMQSCSKMGWFLTDIQLPEPAQPPNAREAVMQFDKNKLCYLVMPERKEITERYAEYKNLYKQFHKNDEAVGERTETIAERVRNVVKFFQSDERFESKDLLVFYVVPEIGRYGAHMFERPVRNEEVIWLNVFMFRLLVLTENWDRLSLYKYAKAYRLFEARTQTVTTDPIDLYSTYKSRDNSFYMDDGARYDFLTITPGTGADLYRDAKIERDYKGILTLQRGSIGYELMERRRNYEFIYESAHSDNPSTLAVNSYPVPVWFVGEFQNKSERGFYKTVIEAMAFWFDRFKSHFSSLFENFSFPVLMIKVKLDPIFFSTLTGPELAAAQFAKDFKDGYDGKGTLHFTIPGNILKELKGGRNQGERSIMLALCAAIRNATGSNLTNAEINTYIEELMPLSPAKMILVYDSQNDFRFDPRWLVPKHLITSAEINLLLDELVEIIAYPTPIPEYFGDRESKTIFCNHTVTKLLDRLQTMVAPFSAEKLLEFLFDLQESLIHSTEQSRIRVPAQIFCFGDKEQHVIDQMDESVNSVKSALAIRCLIEYVAALPPTGVVEPGYDQADQMLVVMNEIITYGMMSDAIRFGLDDPDIGLLKSGRIGVSKSFFEEKLKPFSHANTLADVEYYMENFDDILDAAPHEAFNEDEVDAYYERIDEAFLADWGVRFSGIMSVIKSLLIFGVERKNSVVIMRKQDFIEEYVAHSNMTADEVTAVLNYIILSPRASFLSAPEGYKNEDVFPWKYNREFSIVRRPIAEVMKNGEPYLMWGIRNAELAGRQFNQLFENGRLKYGGERINTLLGEKKNQLGAQYRQEVYEWLRAHGDLKVWSYEVSISKRGPLCADKDYGDIDVLALDLKTGAAYNIECKRTHQAKNIHEMKTEMDAYFGREGQKKKVQKHLDRHEWLTNHLDEFQKFLGTTGQVTVVSLLLTSEVIPAKYIAGSNSPLPLIAFSELKREGIDLLRGL